MTEIAEKHILIAMERQIGMKHALESGLEVQKAIMLMRVNTTRSVTGLVWLEFMAK